MSNMSFFLSEPQLWNDWRECYETSDACIVAR